jgi:hypothetical protein
MGELPVGTQTNWLRSRAAVSWNHPVTPRFLLHLSPWNRPTHRSDDDGKRSSTIR